MRQLRLSGFAVLVAILTINSLYAQPRSVNSKSGAVKVESFATGLSNPWGLAFLPDGSMLVTERGGTLRRISASGEKSGPIAGVPDVYARGQGGLLGIAIDPDFSSNSLVYLAYSEPGEGGASTAFGRGKLVGRQLENFTTIFSQSPKYSDARHFGGRIVFTPQKQLFLTMGERGQGEPSQDLMSGLGKVVRLNSDGSIPEDNPFVGRDDAKAEFWSFGHRNVEAAALHPQTGALWIAEMGPRGGDELNLPEAGLNYGWPHVSWGRQYSGAAIPNPPTRPEFADAIHQWTPVISPSGMTFYTGDLFKQWQGDLFIGSLSRQALVRVEVEDDEYLSEEIIPLGARIRDVVQGPDGALYLLTDQPNGSILRLSPQS